MRRAAGKVCLGVTLLVVQRFDGIDELGHHGMVRRDIFRYTSHFQRVTFVAASGDHGAASEAVLAIGGTSLSLGNYLSESAWSGSGGGLSGYQFEPFYQASFGIPRRRKGCPRRSRRLLQRRPRRGMLGRRFSAWRQRPSGLVPGGA